MTLTAMRATVSSRQMMTTQTQSHLSRASKTSSHRTKKWPSGTRTKTVNSLKLLTILTVLVRITQAVDSHPPNRGHKSSNKSTTHLTPTHLKTYPKVVTLSICSKASATQPWSTPSTRLPSPRLEPQGWATPLPCRLTKNPNQWASIHPKRKLARWAKMMTQNSLRLQM